MSPLQTCSVLRWPQSHWGFHQGAKGKALLREVGAELPTPSPVPTVGGESNFSHLQLLQPQALLDWGEPPSQVGRREEETGQGTSTC